MEQVKIQQIVQNFQTECAERMNTTIDELTVRVFDNTSGVQFTLDEFVNQYNPEDLQKGQAHFVFAITIKEKNIVRFILQDMINCCGIIVNSDVYVIKNYVKRGLGTLINQFCIDFSKYYGYGVLQATDIDTNETQKRIFEKNGWKHISKFANPKTGNNVNIWMYFLNG